MTEFRGRGGGDFGFDNGLTLLVLNRINIERLYLPGGQVYQWARRLGLEVEEVAKAKLFPGRGYITGALQRSVSSSTTPAGQGVQVNVRATAGHAVYYILGTRPHHQEPNSPHKAMRWVAMGPSQSMRQMPDGGGFYRFSKGHEHPGFSGRNFLDEAKREVLSTRGITV